MRSPLLALGLLMTFCASASAETVYHSSPRNTVYHSSPRNHVIARPGQDFHAIPRGAYLAAGPTINYGTPRYDDPSKFGGGEALPVEH
jgi:hypothetical protein